MSTNTQTVPEIIKPFFRPFGGVNHKIGAETDGHRRRYYFYHPWLKTPSGTQKKIIKYTRKEIIAALESAWKANTVNLTRAEYGPWAATRACLERIRMALQAANQSAETIVANVMQQLRSLPAVEAPPTTASEAQNENGPPAQANRPPTEGSPSTRPESTTGAKQQPQAQPPETSASPVNGKPNPPESKKAPGPLTLKEMAVLVLRAHGPLGASEIWEKGLEMGLAESVSAKGSDRVGSLRSILNRAALNPASVIERRDGKFQLKKNAPPAQDSSTDGKRPMAVKFERKDPIPPAPRKPDGRIDWKKVPTELLQKLADNGPIAQIAEAWEVSTSVVYKHFYRRGLHGRHDWNKAAADQSQEKLAALVPPAQQAQPVAKRPMPWDESKVKFLRMLWEVGGPEIARQRDCNPCTVYYHAGRLNLRRPMHGFFLQKDRKIPDDILQMIKQLEVEEAEAEKTSQPAQSNDGSGGPQ